MARIINVSDKLTSEKPKIIVGEKEYEVDDSLLAVLRFEECISQGINQNTTTSAVEIALGKKAANDLDVKSMSLTNFNVLTIAIYAAMQDVTYEEAEARFQK